MKRLLVLLFLMGCGGASGIVQQSIPPQPQAVQPQASQSLPPAAKRIVFIGDSITARWPTAIYFRKTSNAGVGGEHSCQMLARFEEDVLSYSPTHVVILAGINDLYYEPSPSLSCTFAMVTRAQQAGAKVIVGTLLPYEDWASTCCIHDVDAGIAMLKHWNVELAIGAQTYGYALVDYYSLFLLANGHQNPDYFLDGLHPTLAAYYQMSLVLGPMLE